MDANLERIKWSPRIRAEIIQRLYDSDALGLRDDELCNQAGYLLYLRCRTIVMVSRDEVDCPRCSTTFVIDTFSKGARTPCPAQDCGWSTTMLAYRQSWSKKRIWGHNALPAFEEFYTRFLPKLSYQEKMLLIDRLIHSFHWSLKGRTPVRSAANNLIEGSHDQVVAFLDRLSGVEAWRKADWRATMQQMMHNRKVK